MKQKTAEALRNMVTMVGVKPVQQELDQVKNWIEKLERDQAHSTNLIQILQTSQEDLQDRLAQELKTVAEKERKVDGLEQKIELLELQKTKLRYALKDLADALREMRLRPSMKGLSDCLKAMEQAAEENR